MASEAKARALSASIVSGLKNSAGRPYRWLPPEADQLAKSASGESAVFRRVLEAMLERFDLDQCPYALPGSIASLYERDLERLRLLMSDARDEDMMFSLDIRRKDLAILSFRLIPVGAEFAEPCARIWLRKVLTGGFGQFFRAVAFFTLRARAFGPWFQLHMHPGSKEDFHEAGWMATYVRLGELLESNPDHCGWYSASWFVDPALADISPHLAYLWETPRHNGGALFFLWRDGAETGGALATSRTRRQLHSEGRYVPRVYLRVWPRDAAIAWSQRQ